MVFILLMTNNDRLKSTQHLELKNKFYDCDIHKQFAIFTIIFKRFLWDIKLLSCDKLLSQLVV